MDWWPTLQIVLLFRYKKYLEYSPLQNMPKNYSILELKNNLEPVKMAVEKLTVKMVGPRLSEGDIWMTSLQINGCSCRFGWYYQLDRMHFIKDCTAKTKRLFLLKWFEDGSIKITKFCICFGMIIVFLPRIKWCGKILLVKKRTFSRNWVMRKILNCFSCEIFYWTEKLIE